MRICPECLARSNSDLCEREGTTTIELPDESLGRVVAERYVLLEELGRGGTSTVYRAFQRGTRRQVALKILADDEDAEFALRFRREAEITASLKSPHTVTVHDFGQVEGGGLYLAMELLEGSSLEDRIEQRGAISTEEARGILEQIVDSLDEAHQRGLVHRDLKPSNAIVDANGRVTVLDFGLVRVLGEEQRRLTQPGSLFGTPPYMAPEMWSEDPRSAGVAADIYALGAMTFELLTGKLPFEAETLQGFMHAHLEKPAPKIGEVKQELAGTPWERAIAKCLEKRPEDRWSSARAFVADLDRPAAKKRPRAIMIGATAAAIGAASLLLILDRPPALRIASVEWVGVDEPARTQVQRTIEPALRACHEEAPIGTPSRLHLVIRRDGTADARIRPSHPELERCLAPAIAALRLPPLTDGRMAAVTIEIDFAKEP